MSTTLRADIEATAKMFRESAERWRSLGPNPSERVIGHAQTFDACADTLERLMSQHTGEVRTCQIVQTEGKPWAVILDGALYDISQHTVVGQVTDAQVLQAASRVTYLRENYRQVADRLEDIALEVAALSSASPVQGEKK